MRRPIRLGKAGLEVSAFGLGTVTWGTKLVGDELDRLYDAFREGGGNFFDSAHVYAFWLPGGEGASERAVGEIVRRRRDGGKVILATKGGHPALKLGEAMYARPEQYLSAEVISRDVAESLERLGVEAIDLYFLHRDDLRLPVGEIMDVLDEHVRAGRVRAVGASNWSAARIAEANAYAAAKGRTAFMASEAKFSLAQENPSKDPTVKELSPADWAWHVKSQLPVFAYSPAANGYFATGGVKGGRGWENTVTLARGAEAERVVAEVGATVNQVALAWLMAQPFAVVPILGTSNVEHLTEGMGAGRVVLSAEQMARLTTAGSN